MLCRSSPLSTPGRGQGPVLTHVAVCVSTTSFLSWRCLISSLSAWRNKGPGCESTLHPLGGGFPPTHTNMLVSPPSCPQYLVVPGAFSNSLFQLFTPPFALQSNRDTWHGVRVGKGIPSLSPGLCKARPEPGWQALRHSGARSTPQQLCRAPVGFLPLGYRP